MPINVLLKCHDIEATKSFYSEILDFEITDSDKGTFTVKKKIAPSYLHLKIYGQATQNAQVLSICLSMMWTLTMNQ